eukprot:519929_1
MAHNASRVDDLCKRVPLHHFSPQDICDHIKRWVVNDMNHKTYFDKTKQIFANQALSGKRMIGMERTDHIKHIVKNHLLPFMTEDTLDIMFNCYDQWKNKVQPPYDQIASQTAEQMAE